MDGSESEIDMVRESVLISLRPDSLKDCGRIELDVVRLNCSGFGEFFYDSKS